MTYDPRAAGSLCDVCSMGGPNCIPKCVPSDGPPNARLALVGEAPGKNELIKLRPMVGASGIKLEEILWAVGLRRNQVWVGNAASCRLEVPDLEGDGRYSADEYMKWLKKENAKRKKAKGALGPQLVSPFEACRPRLMRELKYLDVAARAAGAPNGVVVQPLGNYALKSLRGVTGIMKFRGSVLLPRPDDFNSAVEGTHK